MYPLLDLGNLSAHLQLRALQGLSKATESSAKRCAEALFEGYGDIDRPGNLRALRFYQSATFLRLSLIYHLRPRWSRLAEPLLQHGLQGLEELDA